MPAGVNTYANQVNMPSIVQDAAKLAINHPSVWRQFITGEMRRPMPVGTQVIEVRKNGRLVRKVVAENAQYVFDSTSEIVQAKTILNPIKSVVGWKETVEVKKFSTALPKNEVGTAMGRAFLVGDDEDISAAVATASSSVSVAGALTPIQLSAAIYDVRTAIRNEVAALKAVLSNKQAYEAGVLHPYNTGNTTTVYANPNSTAAQASNEYGLIQPNGFISRMLGCDVHATDVIEDSGTQYIGAVFDPARAILGVWDDVPGMLSADEVDYLRTEEVMYRFSDFSIHWDEAICLVKSNI